VILGATTFSAYLFSDSSGGLNVTVTAGYVEVVDAVLSFVPCVCVNIIELCPKGFNFS